MARPRPSTGSTAVDANAHCKIRSIPPWVASWDDRCGPAPALSQAVPRRPPQTVPSDHNGAPAAPQKRVSIDGFVQSHDWTIDTGNKTPVPKTFVAKKKQMRRERMGRKYDHLRSAAVVIVPNGKHTGASPWAEYIRASKWAPMAGEKSEKLDLEQFDALMPGFNDTSSVRLTDTAIKKRSRKEAFYEHIWRLALNHPLVPALLRVSVLFLSLCSLGLSANLWRLYGSAFETPGTLKSQWLVAICVDCVVLPYVVYMTWDEYSAPQMGLRSPMLKAALTLLDLVFIIFKSASTTLAFDSLSLGGTPNGEMAKMKALAAFLALGLLGWIMNFTVNVFRIIQKLGPQDLQNGTRPRISYV